MTWTLTTITVNGLIRPTALILQQWDGPAAAAAAAAAGASLSLFMEGRPGLETSTILS